MEDLKYMYSGSSRSMAHMKVLAHMMDSLPGLTALKTHSSHNNYCPCQQSSMSLETYSDKLAPSLADYILTHTMIHTKPVIPYLV
jgi:hypothetical protein